MAQLKLDAFEDTGPRLQWTDQLRVTVSIGKRFEQKGDFQKAADCYETVLHLEPNNTKIRIRLSKCYQRLLRTEEAARHQDVVMQNDPHQFYSLENEANINCELGKFEEAFYEYNRLSKKRKTSTDVKRGQLNVNQILENTLSVDGMMGCLKSLMFKMIKNEHYLNESKSYQRFNETVKVNKCHEDHVKQASEVFYLRDTLANVKAYREQMKDLSKHNYNDKLFYERIQEVVHTFEKSKDDLCRKKPYYAFMCERSYCKFDNRRKVKDLIKLQVAKYINSIVGHCLAGELDPAKRLADLAMKYMDKKCYRPLDVLNALYEVLGLAQYLVNREIPEWSNEMNDKRILFLLGSNIVKNDPFNNVYQTSYFGVSDFNPRNTLMKLNNRLKEIAELTMYSVYLQFERIKCYFSLNEFKRTRPLTRALFADACTLGSIAWQINALMMTVITESRLGNANNCMKILEFLIPLSRTLGNADVVNFVRKIWQFFAEERVQVHEMPPEEKRKEDLIDLMPDVKFTLLMRQLLHYMGQLPPECRMPLYIQGEVPAISCLLPRRKCVAPGDRGKRREYWPE